MDLRPDHKEDPVDVNLTPLIDVVFLLLIFFMVSTTFDRHANLKVNLPEAGTQTEAVKEEPIVLTIDASGKYFINQRQVINTSLDTLKRALAKILDQSDKAHHEQTIVLRADGKTSHQSVVRAMDAAAQLGVTRLSIATVESQP